MEKMIQQIEKELDQDALGSFAFEALLYKKSIVMATLDGDMSRCRSASAAYGGLVKRWRRFLIDTITTNVMRELDTSRQYVQVWQKKIFGRSVSAKDLSLYAKRGRSGGGRRAAVPVDAAAEMQARQLYDKYKTKIKGEHESGNG